MERITKIDKDDGCVKICAKLDFSIKHIDDFYNLQELLSLLWEYENTNLTPQNIICREDDIKFLRAQVKEFMDVIFRQKNEKEQIYNQMIQAQKDYQEVMTFLRNENKRLQNRIIDKELLQEG